MVENETQADLEDFLVRFRFAADQMSRDALLEWVDRFLGYIVDGTYYRQGVPHGRKRGA